MSICVDCGMCCDGTLFRTATLRPDDRAGVLESSGVRLYRRGSGEMSFTLPCAAFHGRCTVYEDRPQVCRTYRCSVLRQVEDGDMAEDDARALIAVTLDLRDRVAPALSRFMEPGERKVLDEVYRSMLRKFDPSSTLAQSVHRVAEAPRAELDTYDVLAFGDLAYRVRGAREADEFGRNAWDDPASALDAATLRLNDQAIALGEDHPDTMLTRECVATWTGLSGRPIEALDSHRSLLTDRARVLGPDHPDTLASRHAVADWTGVSGDLGDAREWHRDLVTDRARVLGPDDPCTLNTRQSYAYWLGASGHPVEAREEYATLAADRLRIFGPDHPDTLAARSSLVHWTGMTGNPGEARDLAGDLLFDRIRVLGPSHVESLATGRALAYWTRRATSEESG